ncbi:MAG TPA: hypothetical protein VNA29_01050 [Sphingomicrobium sp.]|nr:hypothetical protein [Sphingomicrobium sp.]
MAKLSIGKAWDEASKFLAREGRLVAPVALALFAVPAALMGWANPTGDPGKMSGGWLLSLAILLCAMVGQMTIAGLAIGWSGSVGAALGQAFRRLPGMFGAAMLVFLPLTILIVLVIAVMLGGAGLTDPSQLTPEALAKVPQVSLVALVALCAFLFLAVRLFPLAAVAFMETANPVRLVARAWQLTRGHFFRLLALLLLLLIATLVASMAVTAVVGSVMTLAAGDAEPFNLTALVVGLIEGLVGAAISAVSAAMVGRIYVQLTAAPSTVPEVKRDE